MRFGLIEVVALRSLHPPTTHYFPRKTESHLEKMVQCIRWLLLKRKPQQMEKNTQR